MSNQLAPVQWCMGQTLQPADLEAQELSLLTNTKLRFDGLGKPFYGALQLSFDESDIMENAIRLTVFSYILESGELIELGGNAEFIAGKSSVTLPKERNNVDIRINVYQQNSYDHAEPVSPKRQGEVIAEELSKVSKRFYRLELISFPAKPMAVVEHQTQNLQLVAQIKLAEYFADRQQSWVLNERYIPATLQVNRTPAFESFISKLRVYSDALVQEIEENVVSNTVELTSKLHSQQCHLLGRSYAISQFIYCLQDKETQISAHPYELYSFMVELYTLVKVYRSCQQALLNTKPVTAGGISNEPTEEGLSYTQNALVLPFKRPNWQQFRYRHKDLGQTFFSLIEALKRAIYRKTFDYQIKRLEEIDGIYSTELTVTNRANYYLAVWNEDQQMLDTFEPPSKVTSRPQVPMLTHHSIPGLKFRRVNNSHCIQRLEDALAPCMPAAYFEIDTSGKDTQWLQVKQDKSIGFYGQNAFRSSQFFIVIETSHNETNG